MAELEQQAVEKEVTSGTVNSSRMKKVRGLRKAAVLLVFLGEKVTTQVFKSLHDEEVKMIGQEISSMGFIDDETAGAVLKECRNEIVHGKTRLRGELDYVRKVVEGAFEPSVSQEILRFLAGNAITTSESIRAIKYADPQQLYNLVKDEHPQTVALLMSHMEPENAAEVLRLIPEDTRPGILTRLAKIEQVSKPVRNRVTEMVASKLRQSGHYEHDVQGGVRRVAEVLNRLDRKLSRDALENIEVDDPHLALSIRNLMFVFDDILLLDDNDMRKILQRIDKKALVTALKGTPEELREHFYRNMSNRAVEMLNEDMEALGPVKVKEVEAARQQIVAEIREMEASGEIDIGGSGGGDQYVV